MQINPIVQADQSHFAATGHARLSASGSHQWSECTAAPGAQDGLPNNSNEHSRWGTACHLLSEICLRSGEEPVRYLGCVVEFYPQVREPKLVMQTTGRAEYTVPIDSEQVDCSTTFVTFVRDMVSATGGELHVEVKLPISQITGEYDAHGSGDAVILVPSQRLIIVIDLKGGMKQVLASHTEPAFGIHGSGAALIVKPNKQLACYGDGALEMFGRDRFDTVELHIVQPRLNHFDSYRMSTAELAKTISELRRKAEETRTNPQFKPSFENCLFCRAKSTCTARQRQVLTDVLGGFEDLGDGVLPPPRVVKDYELGAVYDALDQIESWCADMRARVYAELMQGKVVMAKGGPLKLAAGRQSPRAWVDPDRARRVMTLALGLRQADIDHPPEMRSPAQIEELIKAKRLTAAEYALLKPLIRQSPGKPVVVRATDHRDAIPSVLDGFADAEQPEAKPQL